MKKVARFLPLALALFLSGCGDMLKGHAAASQGVADFHTLFNDGKLAEIYTASDAKLKAVTSEKEFMEFTQAIQRKLGKVTGTTNTGFNVKSYNFTTTVDLTQQTTFEQGTGKESFRFVMEDGKAVLVSYFINSKELIVK